MIFTVYITIQEDRGREKPRFHLTVENPASITVNEEFIHNIFLKGYTTKTTDTENHGIGLHALKQIANKHHGSIIVKNTWRETNQPHNSYLCMEILL